METVNQRSPSPVEFSSMGTLVLISVEKSGHCLILELGLCYIQNFPLPPPPPNYFKIANQAFFKQSRILSFFCCLFWLFPPLAVVILLLAGQWAKNLEVATPIFQHPGTFWGGSPNEAKLLVRTQALRRGFTSAAVFLLLWALRWL